MRTQIATLTLACLLTATAAIAQQPPTANRGASVSPAADGTLGMALLGAHINADASVNNGAGVTGAIHISAGTYEVDFNRDVSRCFYSAASFLNRLAIDLEPRSGNANGVFLVFISADGAQTLTDSPFYLTVFCAR